MVSSPIFSQVSHFSGYLTFFLPHPFSLESHPSDDNSLNVLPREHLCTANVLPSSLFSVSEVLSPLLPLRSLSFFLCFGLFLLPCPVKDVFCFFWKLFTSVAQLLDMHTHLFHHTSSLFSLLCVFLALLLLPWLTIEEWFNQGECPPFNPSHFSSPPPPPLCHPPSPPLPPPHPPWL